MLRLVLFACLAFVLLSSAATRSSAEDSANPFSVITSTVDSVTDRLSGGDPEETEEPSAFNEISDTVVDAGKSIWGMLDDIEMQLDDAAERVRDSSDTLEIGDAPDLAAAISVEPALRNLVAAHEPPRVGYSREAFPHWLDMNGSGCTARQDLLNEFALEVIDRVNNCWIATGSWYSAYDNVTHIGSSSDLDVDHVVALAEAWDSGASEWTVEQRTRFANDPANLILSSRAANSDKSDRDYAQWQGDNPAHRCTFARTVVQVKASYGLTVDPAEMHHLVTTLASCPAN